MLATDKLDGRTLAVLMHAAQVLCNDPVTTTVTSGIDKKELASAIRNAKRILEYVEYEVVK